MPSTPLLGGLVAAIILWNTRYLGRALTDMGTPDEVARHTAPLGWKHIALAGDYSWEWATGWDPISSDYSASRHRSAQPEVLRRTGIAQNGR